MPIVPLPASEGGCNGRPVGPIGGIVPPFVGRSGVGVMGPLTDETSPVGMTSVGMPVGGGATDTVGEPTDPVGGG